MKIKPKNNIIQVEPLKNIRTKTDIIYDEGEEDKDLIVGKIITINEWAVKEYKYNQNDLIIYGRYAAYPLNVKGTKYYLLDLEDVLGTIEDLKDV